MNVSLHVERCDRDENHARPSYTRRLRHGILPASDEIGRSRSRVSVASCLIRDHSRFFGERLVETCGCCCALAASRFMQIN